MKPDLQERDRLEETATEWVVRRHAGLSVSEEEEFTRWIAEPAHAETFRAMSGMWGMLQRTGREEKVWNQVDHREKERIGTLRRWTLAGMGLAAAAALAIVFLPVRTGPEGAAYTVRPDRQILPDGSRVELNSGAEIEVAFTPQTRTVHLLKGEALFEVAKDPAHAFVVDAGTVSFRAVGTAFVVKRQEHEVGLLVTEGTVAVERVQPVTAMVAPPEPMLVNAGGRVTVPVENPVVAAPTQVTPGELAAELAWRQQRMEFADTNLERAIALFNQQNRVQLRLGDAKLGRRSLTGIFWSNDPETFARLLETSFGLKAERHGEEILLRAAEAR